MALAADHLEVKTVPVGMLATQCYVLSLPGRDDCLVIDPGAEPEKIRRAMGEKQLAAILLRYMEHRGEGTAGRADLSRFSDSAAVADYAREAMAWAVSAGLLQGRANGTLDPAGSATRAQTAVILHRLDALLEGA